MMKIMTMGMMIMRTMSMIMPCLIIFTLEVYKWEVAPIKIARYKTISSFTTIQYLNGIFN